jgi:hypothetical protein
MSGLANGAHLPHTINVPFSNVNRVCTPFRQNAEGNPWPSARASFLLMTPQSSLQANQPVVNERQGRSTAVLEGRAQQGTQG